MLTATTAATEREQAQFEVGTRPQVVKSLGTILKPVGFLASGGESIFSSVFLDVPVPKTPKYDCRKDKLENCTVTEEGLIQLIRQNPEAVEKNQVLLKTEPKPATEISANKWSECLTKCLELRCLRAAFNSIRQVCRLNYIPKSQYSAVVNKAIEKDDRGIIQPGWHLIEVENFEGLKQHCQDNYMEPTLARLYREAAEQEIEDLWSSSNETFINLKKAFQLVEPGTDSNVVFREKRGTGAIVAAIALPLVGLGITFWESFQVRKYVQKLESKFEAFSKETRNFLEKQVVFNRELVKVYEAYGKRIERISCNLDIVSYEVLNRRKFQEWKTITQTLLSGIAENRLTMPVLPRILSLEYIKRLTNGTMFEHTIYRSNPNSVLTLGRMTLVGLKKLEGSWRYHFVLIMPTLKRESIYNRYTVEQVGIETNGTCVKFDMTDEVYEIDGKFYEVLDERCYNRDNTLKICLKPSSEKSKKEHTSAACLNKEHNCKIKNTECEDKISFSVAGLLAYSKSPVKGIAKGAGDSSLVFEVLSDPKSKTNFYSWENYSHIMVGERLIQSIQKPLMEIEIEPITNTIAWNDFVEKTAIQSKQANLTNLVNIVREQQIILQELEKIQNKPVDEFFSSKWGQWSVNIAAYTGVALWLTTIAILWCCRTKSQKKRQVREQLSAAAARGTQNQAPVSHRSIHTCIKPFKCSKCSYSASNKGGVTSVYVRLSHRIQKGLDRTGQDRTDIDGHRRT